MSKLKFKFYLRQCKRCGKIFYATGKFSKVCSKCRKIPKPKYNPTPIYLRRQKKWIKNFK